MLILMYQISPQKKNQIQKLCQKMRIEIKEVKQTEYDKVIGVTAGILPSGTVSPQDALQTTISQEKSEKTTGALMCEQPEEMLVFCGMPSPVMEEFLKCYKEEKIAPIPLKAVVTQYNIFWTFRQLQEELKRERREMGRK